MSGMRKRQMTLFVMEGAVSVTVCVLLAGLWLGAPYQSPGFVRACLFGSGALGLAVLGYAVVARRFWVVLALPVLGLTLVFPPFVILPPLATGIIGLPIALVGAVIRWTRGGWLVVASCVLLVGLIFGAIDIYANLQADGVRRAVRRAEPVIAAIDRYEVREGHWPAALEDLVPRDLEKIPGTGMAGYRSFRYYGPDGDFPYGRRLFETYELRVDVGRILQFDCFVYWPERSYPDRMYGGMVERMGSWAYVHE
jgi:hypothetical protein